MFAVSAHPCSWPELIGFWFIAQSCSHVSALVTGSESRAEGHPFQLQDFLSRRALGHVRKCIKINIGVYSIWKVGVLEAGLKYHAGLTAITFL